MFQEITEEGKLISAMKRKKLALILGFILFDIFIVFVLYFLVFTQIGFGDSHPTTLNSLDPHTLLTSEQAASDRDLAIQFLENVHPYFVTHDDLSAYEHAKQTYIDSTSKELTVGAFQAATAKYFCFFKDGHTNIRWTETMYLDLKQMYKDGKTYCLEDGSISDKYITHMGHIPIKDIYNAIDQSIPSENPMGLQCNRENYLMGKNFLQYAAGVKIEENSLDITFSDGSANKYSFCKSNDSAFADYAVPLNTWQMDNDIFVINFKECTDDENLMKITEALKKALQQGCEKVIIDARGNSGGNSNACLRLLNAMDMTPPEYDVLIRYSPEANEQRGYASQSDETYHRKGSDESHRNENIRLAVLCDRYTYSSANMLCVWVRDGNLGTIIGESSSNSPSHYGDILSLTLPNSHIFATVSHKKFVRPNENNTENMLIPDIQTSSQKAYEKALEYLNQSH